MNDALLSRLLELVEKDRTHECEVVDMEGVPIRMHFECLTGDAIGSLRCDCRGDERDYSVAAHMILSLRVRSVALMTNDPKKILGLEEMGVKVSRDMRFHAYLNSRPANSATFRRHTIHACAPGVSTNR